MRRKDKELSNVEQMENILRLGKTCHIALTLDNEPYLFTVNYGYKDSAIYFHSAPDGKKIEWIKKNPSVFFQVIIGEEMVSGTNPCRDWTMKYKSVTGSGAAAILNSTEEKITGLNILMAQYTDKGPFEFTEKNLQEIVVVKIKIIKLTAKISGY